MQVPTATESPPVGPAHTASFIDCDLFAPTVDTSTPPAYLGDLHQSVSQDKTPPAHTGKIPVGDLHDPFASLHLFDSGSTFPTNSNSSKQRLEALNSRSDNSMTPKLQSQFSALNMEDEGYQGSPAEDEDESDVDSGADNAVDNKTNHRRKQQALFDSWAEDAAVNITKEGLLEATRASGREITETNTIFGQSAEKIVNFPREYQLELFERAKQQNTIAVLDTGSGKTLIAVLLLRYTIEQELERRRAGNSDRVSFFLVNSVALVMQQHNVLERNLDYKIGRLYGDMGVATWRSQQWKEILDDNMVIVCTADILVQALVYSFVTMEQINLLIFDEAHHAKKEHAYARLVRDFYFPQTIHRPRIFGMTASPMDVKSNEHRQIAEALENLLDSRIATVSDLNKVRQCISTPEELVLEYEPIGPPFETILHQLLVREFGDLAILENVFDSSKHMAPELGSWCATAYLGFAFEESKLHRLSKQAERPEFGRVDSYDESEVETGLRAAATLVKQYPIQDPQLAAKSSDLSSKVKSFVTALQDEYKYPTHARCIVFVDRRKTAYALEHLLSYSHICGPYLKAASFVGTASSVYEASPFSTRKQVLTMAKFRTGEINCLIATSIAEEGLDIPDCNLVIRFDLYKNMIGYVQSRGRARHLHSKYVHMIERGNRFHRDVIMQAVAQEASMREFCQKLPKDRRLDEDDGFSDSILSDPSLKGQRFATHPKSKAKLTYKEALIILANFVASLPGAAENFYRPEYIPSTREGKFAYEVLLPEGSPIRSVEGRPERRKLLAKCSAAYDACCLLIKKGFLDENFKSTFARKLPEMRNAHLAIDSKKTTKYNMLLKPTIWQHGRGSLPQLLYMTILGLPNGCGGPIEQQPMALLTRSQLPDFPSFPLYMEAGHESWLASTSLKAALKADIHELELVDSFTQKIYLHVFAKEFESNFRQMSYWLAPVRPECKYGSTSNPYQLIDWEALEHVANSSDTKWKQSWKDDSVIGKFFWDPYDGGKRYFSLAIMEGLDLTSPVPESVEGSKQQTIKDFTVSLWSKAAKKREQYMPYDVEQPVLKVHRMIERRNVLDVPMNAEKESQLTAFVIPEPLERSPLSPRIVATALALPSIIHRFESYLIAMETCQLLGLEIPLDLALEAITKDSDNTEEHGEQQVSFRRGMGKNYERLEFLGDCFLKMATSITVYTQQPNENEFEFHVRRMLLLCNKNLFKHATELELPKYVRSQSFSRRLWYQDGLKLLKGKKLGREGQDYEHSLSDKTVADVCEALIGAAFLAHNRPGSWTGSTWDQGVHAVTKFVASEDHQQESWDDYLRGYVKPNWQDKPATAAELQLAAKIENQHPYHFNSPKLLQVSFQHPSYPKKWNRLPSYQRLEFLGDSLLDMASVTHLFYRYPSKDPHWLTEHKMAIVSNKFLGALCVKLGFHKSLLHNHDDMHAAVLEYATEVEEEAISHGAMDYWTVVKDPPKCLPDIVEAYVGAAFVDSGFDYNEVQRFFDMHMKPFFEDMSIYDTFANNHPTTRLYQLLDSIGCSNYRIMAKEIVGPGVDETKPPVVIAAVMIHGKVIADGRAQSGKYAKVKASKKALEQVEGQWPALIRSKYGCNCGPKKDVDKLTQDAVQDTAI
ncbi:MAG: Dicer-like protein 1 [Bogoriella megaspora]|nr:MAG: Dicer-like protein 1 [Bogoriella megaspora]